jgi:hypothetical protein
LLWSWQLDAPYSQTPPAWRFEIRVADPFSDTVDDKRSRDESAQIHRGLVGAAMQVAHDAKLTDRRSKVWLECTGEPFDFRSVQICRVTRREPDVEWVRFFCPRCGYPHESLRFY